MAPRMLRRALPLACLTFSLLLVLPLDASAQRPSALRDGRRALSFNVLTSGGAGLGYSVMLSPRSAFTIDFNGDVSLISTENSTDDAVTGETDSFDGEITLAPGYRRYMAGRGEVASYIAAKALLGFASSINENTAVDGSVTRVEQWSPLAGAALGFGLEWFVTDEMSLRGEIALDGTWEYRNSSNSSGSEQTSHVIEAGLGQSGIAFSIWF
ncbi:MAG TPA: hypothetical protein VF039_13270 [Longimicrobiales bacterium]